MRKPALIASAALLASLAGGCKPPPAETVAAAPLRPTAVKPFDPKDVPDVRFVEITGEAGITFRHSNAAAGKKLLPETMGSGVAFLDYDNDGDPDLFLVNSMPWADAKTEGPPPTQALYRNDGKGHFEDVTKAAGLDRTLFGMGVAVGDYDNDGDPDLYLTALGGNVLFRNEGNGRFEDVTAATRTGAGEGWSTSAAFFDMENDGDLDLFVCRYVEWSEQADASVSTQLLGTGNGSAYDPPSAYGGAHCILFRNDGGTFADVSAEAGIQVFSPDRKVPTAKSLGVAPYDVDGDGLVDLAVANDTVTNFLFHNLGGGKFEEIGVVTGIALDEYGSTRAAMGIDWADFKNDGSLGLAIGNYANEMTALYVSEEPSRLLFSDLAKMNGLGAPTQPPLKFGLFFFDYDLDGRLDLLSTNGHLESDIAKVQASETYAQAAQLFWNTGKAGRSRFVLADATKAGPDLFKPIVGRGSAYADIDGDGDLDVAMTENGGPAHLFRNDGGSKNHWLRLALVGTGKSNRDATGAKVEVRSGETVARRQLFAAKGYLSSVEPVLTFGLGELERADSVRITWPSGRVSELKDLGADRVHRIEEAGPGDSEAPKGAVQLPPSPDATR
ncbi:CRTAC1 family protein [Tundrisphaera sp. TA3]|uniref:CRTAC1 family protein n=1 Tax=Tundrisphaera sp. TA3 TaxID=3435775 RepID=UPI003EBFC050